MKRLVLVLLAIVPVNALGQMDSGMNMEVAKPDTAIEKGLGHVDHPVTTKNAMAQQFFDQGLAYIYAFNHQEAIRSFKQAAVLDPNLAMAYWGIALSMGSNYNLEADSPQ